MTGPESDDSSRDDDQLFADLGLALAEAIEEGLPRWVEQAVTARAGALADQAEAVNEAVANAGHRAAVEVGAQLRELLVLDVDQQWTNPLSIVRSAVQYPTELLTALNVAPVDRDHVAAAHYPNDIYDLLPVSFADFGPVAHEQGIMWGAAKAHLHLQRRRAT